MDADLDTLATALYVFADDLVTDHPERVPPRPRVGIAAKITDAELLTLAVLQALLGYTSERRWLRYARTHLLSMFPTLPGQSGYHKRQRKLADTMSWMIGVLAADTSLAGDDVWLVDPTPVECGRSRETVNRSDLAGWAEYGYCAAHSRFFWGLRLHLVCTVHGLPLGWALTGAKADGTRRHPHLQSPADHRTRPATHPDRRQELLRQGVRDRPHRAWGHPASANPPARTTPRRRTVPQTPAADHRVCQRHPQRPARPRTPPRPHPARGLRPRRQRILALTTAIWHNDYLGLSIRRSLTAYDH